MRPPPPDAQPKPPILAGHNPRLGMEIIGIEPEHRHPTPTKQRDHPISMRIEAGGDDQNRPIAGRRHARSGQSSDW